MWTWPVLTKHLSFSQLHLLQITPCLWATCLTMWKIKTSRKSFRKPLVSAYLKAKANPEGKYMKELFFFPMKKVFEFFQETSVLYSSADLRLSSLRLWQMLKRLCSHQKTCRSAKGRSEYNSGNQSQRRQKVFMSYYSCRCIVFDSKTSISTVSKVSLSHDQWWKRSYYNCVSPL